MSDSVGSGFPTRGIQRGHIFFDTDVQTLFVYLGGDAANSANWKPIAAPNVQRWPTKFIGTEVSVGFGLLAEANFVAPVNGTITKWGLIVGSVVLPAVTDVELQIGPSNESGQLDAFSIPVAENRRYERALSLIDVPDAVIAAGTIVRITITTTYSPANHAVKISGYVDFEPSQ